MVDNQRRRRPHMRVATWAPAKRHWVAASVAGNQRRCRRPDLGVGAPAERPWVTASAAPLEAAATTTRRRQWQTATRRRQRLHRRVLARPRRVLLERKGTSAPAPSVGGGGGGPSLPPPRRRWEARRRRRRLHQEGGLLTWLSLEEECRCTRNRCQNRQPGGGHNGTRRGCTKVGSQGAWMMLTRNPGQIVPNRAQSWMSGHS